MGESSYGSPHISRNLYVESSHGADIYYWPAGQCPPICYHYLHSHCYKLLRSTDKRTGDGHCADSDEPAPRCCQ